MKMERTYKNDLDLLAKIKLVSIGAEEVLKNVSNGLLDWEHANAVLSNIIEISKDIPEKEIETSTSPDCSKRITQYIIDKKAINEVIIPEKMYPIEEGEEEEEQSVLKGTDYRVLVLVCKSKIPRDGISLNALGTAFRKNFPDRSTTGNNNIMISLRKMGLVQNFNSKTKIVKIYKNRAVKLVKKIREGVEVGEV